ncbi:hypothetical protein LOK49_LG12G00558 [Camellia lanceoleosa]|uniref:Uncharacterized protein n=1 Tax=Camellia lanceoleosa TaxID=1840588 RepID=A0ACC0FRU7_9ERIC|nr:hypothetical protein LOK49_LG12G00558 [Camellia lanceoleosa]
MEPGVANMMGAVEADVHCAGLEWDLTSGSTLVTRPEILGVAYNPCILRGDDMDVVRTSNLEGPVPGNGQTSLVRNIKNNVRKEVKLLEFEYGVGQRFRGSVNNIPTFNLADDTVFVKGCGGVENSEKKEKINKAYTKHDDRAIMWADGKIDLRVYLTDVKALVTKVAVCGNVINAYAEVLLTKQMAVAVNQETIETSYFFSSICLAFGSDLDLNCEPCTRHPQLKSSGSLSKLQGYSNQAILTSLGCPVGPKHRTKGHKSNGEEDEDFMHEGRGAKRNTSSRGNQRLEAGNSGATNSIPGKERIKSQPTYKKLRIKLSNRELSSFKLVGPPQPPIRASFKVDEKIELLCQDSGIRGCWFRCKVLQASQKRLKVQYVDVEDAEGSGNLEEWVPASIVAAPDKLGLRCLGRLTVRPWPSEDSSNGSVEVGASVDACWSDGWWEGVVTGVDESGNDSLQVYFPAML